MKTHVLKCWPEYFKGLIDGTKTAEFRLDDRGFEVGDRLVLREYAPANDAFSGREVTREIGWIDYIYFVEYTRGPPYWALLSFVPPPVIGKVENVRGGA